MISRTARVLERAEPTQLQRAKVLEITQTGAAVLQFEGRSEPLMCGEQLANEELPLTAGTSVLVWFPAGGESPIIIGRIESLRVPSRETDNVPETLTIEAKESITLRVGDGAITIRDGKILIKGKDLVSHAQRTNRIRGGSVAIN